MAHNLIKGGGYSTNKEADNRRVGITLAIALVATLTHLYFILKLYSKSLFSRQHTRKLDSLGLIAYINEIWE